LEVVVLVEQELEGVVVPVDIRLLPVKLYHLDHGQLLLVPVVLK